MLKTKVRKIPDPLPAPFKTHWTKIDLEHKNKSIHFLFSSTYKEGSYQIKKQQDKVYNGLGVYYLLEADEDNTNRY